MPTARQIRWARFRVVVVAVVASLILVVFVYLLTGGTLLEPKATLFLYVPDASGLGPGSPVRVDGIGVGKVSSVVLSGSRLPARVVKVALKVEANHLAAIPVDSTADIGTDSLLGDQFIGIKSGSSPAHVRPGGEILLKPQATSLDLVQFTAALRSMDVTLRDIENGKGPLGQFVKGDDLYRSLLRGVTQVEKFLRTMQTTTGAVGQLLYTDTQYQQIVTPLLAIDQTLARLQAGQGAGGRLLQDSAQYDQWRAALGDLRRSIADFEAAPLLSSDAAYQQWNRSVAAIIQRVDEFNAGPMFSSSEMYDNLTGAAQEMRHTLHDFQANPRKYMRLKVF
jgi:phospholipid/cholesterol/gamma-HCH transport system substrate-binding protein